MNNNAAAVRCCQDNNGPAAVAVVSSDAIQLGAVIWRKTEAGKSERMDTAKCSHFATKLLYYGTTTMWKRPC